MKKSTKKLMLAKETVRALEHLRALEHPELVAGGATIRISCEVYNCTLGSAASGCGSSLC